MVIIECFEVEKFEIGRESQITSEIRVKGFVNKHFGCSLTGSKCKCLGIGENMPVFTGTSDSRKPVHQKIYKPQALIGALFDPFFEK